MTKRRYLMEYYDLQYSWNDDEIEKTKVVNDSDDVFEFLKQCYISDAHGRNNYPLNGNIHYNCIQFWEQYYQTCNLGHDHVKESLSISHPEFYYIGLKKFKEWEKRVKTFIPKIREKVRQEKIKNKELKELERLKNKYE